MVLLGAVRGRARGGPRSSSRLDIGEAFRLVAAVIRASAAITIRPSALSTCWLLG
jgi:hypothetical protein